MTSIERTAYPRLNANRIISQNHLLTSYTLNSQEISHIKSAARTKKLRLYYALQLKTFQDLGYFVEVDQIPQSILINLRNQLGLIHNLQIPTLHSKTLYRQRQSIRRYLNVIPWGLKGETSAGRVAIRTAYQSAQTLNMPADIINVVIEDLRVRHFELPAFNTLFRLVRHVRAIVHRAIFQRVFDKLTQENKISALEGLLKVPKGKTYSPYQALKNPPKTSRINDFKELIHHHTWLLTLGDPEPFLKDISKPKRLQFAQEAKSLDISNLLDISDSKRYSLIACLVDHIQKKTKDDLAEVFCKTMATIHKRARAELLILREKNVNQTQELAYFARSVLGTFKDNVRDHNTFFENVSATIESKGGIDELTQTCEQVIAYNSTHHHPLLWTYFKPRRAAVFDVLETIKLGSSTQHENLMRSVEFLITQRQKRSEFLEAPSDLNLNFISDAWQKLVYEGPSQDLKLNRRFFEVCVFTYLSYELLSGDIFIKGADAFSDYESVGKVVHY